MRGADGTGILVKIFHPTVDAFAVDLHIAASDRLRDELERKRGSKGFVVAYDADSGRG